jgi:hypothetical protein
MQYRRFHAVPYRERSWPLHQVVIDPKLTEADIRNLFYFYVPTEERARHEQAVKALFDLGAKVSRLPPCRVQIGERFRGGDEALSHLKDLHGLTELYLVKARVTGEGLKYVTDQEQLQVVCCYQTKLQPEGLRHLAKLNLLEALDLNGTFRGEEYGDDDLQYLAGLAVRRITLYGPDFTDAAIPRLKRLRGLQAVDLHGCRISSEAQKELGKLVTVRDFK